MSEAKSTTGSNDVHYLKAYISTGVSRTDESTPWVLKLMPQSCTVAVVNTTNPSEHAWYEGNGFFYTGIDGKAIRISDDKIVVAPVTRNGGSTFEIYVLQDTSDAIIIYVNGMSEIYLIVNSEKSLPEERFVEYTEKHCVKPFDFFASGVMLPPM